MLLDPDGEDRTPGSRASGDFIVDAKVTDAKFPRRNWIGRMGFRLRVSTSGWVRQLFVHGIQKDRPISRR